jgi:hypothetical protein
MDGYIFVHRKIMDSPVFADPWLFKIWMWCLFKAAYTPKKVNIGSEIITLERGQFVYGRKKAVEELSDSKNKISESSFYRRTAFLEKNGSIVQKSNNRYTLVTVVNYDIYQPFFEESEQRANSGRTASEHKEKNKKINNNNPLLSPFKKRGKKGKVEGSYDLELYEQMLNGKE